MTYQLTIEPLGQSIEVEEEQLVAAPTLPPAEVEAIEPEDDSEAVSTGGLGGLLSRIIPRSTEKRSAEEIEAELDALGEEEVPEEFLEELPEEDIEFDPDLAGSPLAKKGSGKAAPPVDQDAINHEVDDRRLAPDEAEEGLSDKASDIEELEELRAKVAAKKAAPAKVETIEADEEEIAGITADASYQPLEGKHVLVTAGPTWESIDPVRYIGNRSSGKMGNALASAAASRGAHVVLVTSASPPADPSIEVVPVATAEEMAEATWSRTADADIAILAAAVADFRPVRVSGSKIRRAEGIPEIALEPTPDVLAGVVERNPDAFVVGFAAESGSLDAVADKARAKQVDLLVANDVARPGSGFGTDTNEVVLVRPDGTLETLPLMTKAALADAVLDAVVAARV